MTKPSDLSNLSFEDALAELELIVRQLEDGRVKLDDAIVAYERGALLKKHAEEKLKQAQSRIEKISIDEQGNITATPTQLD